MTFAHKAHKSNVTNHQYYKKNKHEYSTLNRFILDTRGALKTIPKYPVSCHGLKLSSTKILTAGHCLESYIKGDDVSRISLLQAIELKTTRFLQKILRLQTHICTLSISGFLLSLSFTLTTLVLFTLSNH